MNELFTVVEPQVALQMLLRHCAPVERFERIALGAAHGRVVARPYHAGETLPAFPRSTMDGYAVRASDTFGASDAAPAYFRLCGEVSMGTVPTIVVRAFEAARTYTGAMLPSGADAVIMVEDTNAHGDEVELLASAAPGENVIGVGEDVRRGEVAIPAGRRLRAQDLGGLAALGEMRLDVVARPRVAILSTGDEVVEPWETPATGQVRDVNATTLAAVISAAGGDVVHCGIVADDEAALIAATRAALERADALVLSAGSSVSDRDLTARVIEHLGQPGILVHGIAIKPGKPTLIAVAGGKPVIGLPGNPVSALVLAWRIVAPLVRRLAGERASAVSAGSEVDALLTAPVRSRPGREDFVPCTLERRDGALLATPIFGKSNLIFTLVHCDGLIAVPLDQSGVSVASVVRVIVP